jgi:hypothetical protein
LVNLEPSEFGEVNFENFESPTEVEVVGNAKQNGPATRKSVNWMQRITILAVNLDPNWVS